MATSSLLTPPATDISIQYLTQLFGSGWQSLLNGGQTDGVTTLLGSMFTTFNVALMGFVVTLLVWQVTVGAMQTAHEGVTLGKRYHTIWAPMRAPFAIAMLTPLPLIKGLTILQALGMLAVSMSIGLADTVWNSFTDYAANNSGDLAVSMAPDMSNDMLMNSALEMEVLAAASNASGVKTDWNHMKDGFEDQQLTYTYGFSQGTIGGVGIYKSDYGSISFTCGQPPETFGLTNIVRTAGSVIPGYQWLANATITVTGGAKASQSTECMAAKKAVEDLHANLSPIAQALIDKAQGKGTGPTNAQFTQAKKTFSADIAAIMNAQGGADQKAKIASEIQAWSKTAQSFGWVASTFYYPSLTAMVGQYNELVAKATPIPNRPDVNSIVADGGVPKADMESYLTALSAFATTNGLTPTGDTTQDKTYWMLRFMGNSLRGYAADLQQGNLLVVLAAHGNDAVNIGMGLAGAAMVSGLVGGGIKAVSGGGFNPVGAFVGGLISQLGSILGAVAGVLIVEGGIMVYVLPSVPSFVMMFAVLGWVVLVMELFVALPLFAAAFAFAEGEGMAPQQTQHGISVIGGILLRPVLLVFGFAFVFLLMNVAGHLLGVVFGALVATFANSRGIGPVAYAFLLGILVTTATALVYFVAKLMTHLAEFAPRWIGGNSGSDLGVGSEGAQAMKEGAGKGSAGAAAGVSYAATSIGNAQKQAAQAGRDARQDAAIKNSAGGVDDAKNKADLGRQRDPSGGPDTPKGGPKKSLPSERADAEVPASQHQQVNPEVNKDVQAAGTQTANQTQETSATDTVKPEGGQTGQDVKKGGNPNDAAQPPGDAPDHNKNK